MEALKAVAGLHSLTNIIARESSSRVLDLNALAAENPNDPDYARLPLFTHPVLNRSIIVKHNLGSTEGDRAAPGRFNTTKVIFPFDLMDLDLGGQLLFVGQRSFVRELSRHLDYSDLSLERDVAVLRTLDRLPTLDPFLIREVLRQQNLEVARCYYRFSEADKADMLQFVADEISVLVRASFGNSLVNEDKMQRLSKMLLNYQDSDELEPLRLTFGMNATEFSEAMFAWKAFLYYRWRSQDLAPLLQSTLRSISSIRAGRYERDDLSFVIRAKQLLERAITQSWREVGQRLALYEEAFDGFTNKGRPEGFRSFLLRGSNLFRELGDRIGRLEQTVNFWGERFGEHRMTGRAPDDLLDGIRDLLQALSLELSIDMRPKNDMRSKKIEQMIPIDRVAAAKASGR